MLLNPNASNEWTVGDFCFYHELWSDAINKALITNIAADTVYIRDTVNGGTVAHPMNCIFKTEEDGLAAFEAENEARVNEYCSRINTIEDLVRFAFDETVSLAEEYSNMNARNAYAKKAKELLGIELED